MKLLNTTRGELPSGYVLHGVRIERSTILASYRSSGRPQVQVRLRHPGQGHVTDLQTTKFAVSVADKQKHGTAEAQALLTALTARLRRLETGFRWHCAQPTALTVYLGKTPQSPAVAELLYGSLLLALLAILAGVLLRLRWRTDRPQATRRRLDRYDRVGLGLLAGYGVVLAWLITGLPIRGDEIGNYRPDYWQNWYTVLMAEFPPLYLWMVHALALGRDPLWLMRMPILLGALASLWLLYGLVRQRAGGRTALLLTALLAGSSTFWAQAIVQKPYALWLAFGLAAYGNFHRALQGEKGRWGWYALWTMLACQVHFLAVLWTLGQLAYVSLHRRDVLKSLTLALSPAALSLAPLVYPILSLEAWSHKANAAVMASVGGRLKLLISMVVPAICMLVLILFPHRRPRKEPALEWTLATAVGLTLLLSLWIHLSDRHLYPALALCLVLIGASFRWADGRAGRILQALCMTPILIVVVMNSALGAHARWREMHAPRLYPLYLRHRSATAASATSRLLLIWSPQWSPRVLYQAEGKRQMWKSDCHALRVRRGSVTDTLHVHMPLRLNSRFLDRLRARVGSFDVLRYQPPDERLDPSADAWLRSSCKALVTTGLSRRFSEAGTAYRCGHVRRSKVDLCAAVRSLSNQAVQTEARPRSKRGSSRR